MRMKRFFSKRMNILIFVTVIFGVIGFLLGFIVPNTLFESQINNIEQELHDMAYNHENITEVDSTDILYIYKDGESSMLTSSGYITDINYDVEHHLIHWSEDQFVESLLYRDDFQNKQFIYYIYVVRDEYYVVSFADTKEVHMFVDNFRLSSMISIGVLYILSMIFSTTIFSSSLVRHYSLFDPVTNLNTKTSLFNKYNNKDLSNYRIQYANIYNLDNIVNASGVRFVDDIVKVISSNISKYYSPESIFQISPSEYVILNKIGEVPINFKNIINIKSSSMSAISTYEFKVKLISIDQEFLLETDIDNLIKQFVFAYSKIKSKKQNEFVITHDLIIEMEQEMYYQARLGKAIKDGNIINHYQPKVCPRTGHIIGAEALSRWQTEDGIISPSKYIHLAEANGSIYDIDIISFQNAIKFIKSLEEQEILEPNFKISTNFSPITLKNVTFEQIKNMIAYDGVDPKHISIEITESVVLEYEVIEELLKQLIEYGITIEIDDFSAGNSSFTVLSTLNANIVKLDRAILPDSNEDEREKLIYHSLVDISKKLGMKIISEGVETDVQKTFVKELGIDGIQGYYYSKPLDKTSFITYLNKEKDLS